MQDRDQPNKWLVTAAVVCGTLCIGVTMSMMNLAIPLMISALQTDIDTIQWIITGPMLVNIALVPLVSWLTSLIGSRQVYLWAIAIWIATSWPCGLSDTAGGVIFYRLLQGVGGSLHIPTVITVMYQAFPFHQRGLAMGIQQGAQWAAPAIGMTLGGYLLQWHGWRAAISPTGCALTRDFPDLAAHVLGTLPTDIPSIMAYIWEKLNLRAPQ